MTHGRTHDGKNAARINGLNDDDSSAHDSDGDDSDESCGTVYIRE